MPSVKGKHTLETGREVLQRPLQNDLDGVGRSQVPLPASVGLEGQEPLSRLGEGSLWVWIPVSLSKPLFPTWESRDFERLQAGLLGAWQQGIHFPAGHLHTAVGTSETQPTHFYGTFIKMS